MIKVTVKGQKDLDFFCSSRRLTKAFSDAVKETNETAGQELRDYLKQRILDGPKTGRIYIIGGRAHQASAPGEAPANLSGALQKSTDYKQRGKTLEVGYGVFYGQFLEDGTSRMRPRPNIKLLPKKYHEVVQSYFPSYLEKSLR